MLYVQRSAWWVGGILYFNTGFDFGVLRVVNVLAGDDVLYTPYDTGFGLILRRFGDLWHLSISADIWVSSGVQYDGYVVVEITSIFDSLF